MKKEYDIIYLTNTPSFYKINLCNEIAESASVLLVFYGYGSEAVNKMLKSEDSYKSIMYFSLREMLRNVID